MVKLIVIAGSNSQKLADFFEKRGTFEIVEVYDSLTSSVNQIQNKVITSDKLLYLYNDSEDTNMNIKSDMQILGNLLNNDSFFKPGEIIFMSKASQQSTLATKFFITVMQDCNKSDYSLKTVEDKMSFAAIYDLMMGTTNSAAFHNSYKTLYKVERNAKADTEYSPKDSRNMVIEPIENNSVIAYSDSQQAAKKADTGTVYTDDPDTILHQNDTIQFDTLKLKSIDNAIKYVLVSGLTKSGKSVWASQLAVSAYKCGLTTLVMDFTRNSDIMSFLNRSTVNPVELSMVQVLRRQSKEDALTYTSPSSVAEEKVILDFVQLFINQKIVTADVVLIACEINQLANLRSLFTDVVDVVITSNAVMDDINVSCEYLPMFSDRARCTLILNRIASIDDMFIDAQDLRPMLPEKLRIVKDKRFINFDAKEQLFKAVIGN